MADSQDIIVRIAARGDGVTESGQHIRGAAPGDELLPDGGLIKGPHHVAPSCRHFDQCGGCVLQHIDMSSYSAFLRERVRGALKGQGITDIPILEPRISKSHSRRRTSFRVMSIGKSVHIGFNTEQSHRVVDAQQCDILHPDIFALFAPLRQFFKQWNDKKLNLIVTAALVDQGVDILIKNLNPDTLEHYENLSAFGQKHGLARLSIDRGEGTETLYAPEPATVTLGATAVELPAGSFLQATLDGEKALCETVSAWLGQAAIVADLFSGLGTFALTVAEKASGKARKIYAAEAARDSVLALKSAVNRHNLAIFTEHRDLFRRPLTHMEANRFDAIILDPPRAGAREQVMQLAQSNVNTVIYVSCNPSSFARDSKTLIENGYILRRVQPVGQFLWSTHVELVGQFTKNSEPAE